MTEIALGILTDVVPARSDREALRALASEFETSFLAQMLESSGVARESQDFGGGIGEEHMRGFLLHEQARAIVAGGGIGLAETVFRYLSESEAADVPLAPR